VLAVVRVEVDFVVVLDIVAIALVVDDDVAAVVVVVLFMLMCLQW
jgi:hypothetical protein